MHFSAICVLVVCWGCLCAGQELLTNAGFENGVTGWRNYGFTMETENVEVHEGVASVKCTGRTHAYEGPGQDIQVRQGARYKFSSYVKLIDDLGSHGYQTLKLTIRFDWTDDGTSDYLRVANIGYVTEADGWLRLAGDFTVANRAFSQAYLYLEGPQPEVGFYFDDASLLEMPDDVSWETEAHHNIETLRKSNIHFDFNVAANFDVNELQVKIDHVRHLFGFGSLVNVNHMLDTSFQKYQDIVYYMFNWATIQDYKWLFDKGNRTHPDYTRAVATTDLLLNHGMNVRGHCMFWAVQGHEPNWITPLTGSALMAEVDKHIAYMTGISKGKLSHWDINNELLHGHFYEEGTNDGSYTHHMFQAVHSADPKPVLFLNDYNVVNIGQYTSAFLDQILEFQAANVGLGGIGVQSHWGDRDVDPTSLKYRLDLLAQAGLPIWVTELDMPTDDETLRADRLETIFRVYFSHPAVEGIIFWGFWDQEMEHNKALLRGSSLTPTEAGLRYLHLVKDEWSTHVTKDLSSGTSFDLSGFQGDYDVTVLYHGKPIQLTSFSLGKTPKTVAIDISGDGHEIQVPVQTDPFSS